MVDCPRCNTPIVVSKERNSDPRSNFDIEIFMCECQTTQRFIRKP